jgi:hypothetical protein
MKYHYPMGPSVRIRLRSLVTAIPFVASGLFIATAVHAGSGASRMPWHQYTPEQIAIAVEGLQSIESAELDSQWIAGLQARAIAGTLNDNDANLICIGALAGTFGATFGIGLVPNPPWDYLLGQLPAYAANLGLKFCRPVLEAPADIEVAPNVASADGNDCAYAFSQPIIEGTREDFMGLPLQLLGNWAFNTTPDSRAFGTPTAFHYNTEVKVRLFLPGEAPPGYVDEIVDQAFVSRLTPRGIFAANLDPFITAGCLLDGSVTESITGVPCPIDLDRRITLPVGSHSLRWRAETSVGLLDVLPPVYVPGTPPGSKKALARAILENAFEALGLAVVGSFQEDYRTGVVSVRTQQVNVLDTTVPQISLDPALEPFRIEAQEPGGQRTRGLREVLRTGIEVSDTCNRTPQLSVPVPPFLPLGTHQLTWTASDDGPAPGGGVNSASVVQTVIVEDTRAPEIQAPPAVVSESAVAPVTLDIGVPLVFDVVDLDPLIERDGPSSFPFGVSNVRWRAVDASGNATPWVEQRITVKAPGSNTTPVAADGSASAISFAPTTIQLSASDADGDHLYFYIDREPEEGFFVAPLLPVFVEDLRVQAQFDPGAVCLGGGTLPPQNYVYLPEYITVDDQGNSFVIDRKVRCAGGPTGINSDDTRFAQISADGELLAEQVIGSDRPTTVAIHPGGLPGYAEPFIYWVSATTGRLRILPQTLVGSFETLPLDLLPSGTQQLGDPVDAVIDSNGVVYVISRSRLYAYDFLARNSSNGPLFLGRVGELFQFGRAWDMDIDSGGNLYVGDFGRHRIYKFGRSSIERPAGGPVQFSAGVLIGWMGACTSDSAPGGAAACDVASGRSLGYSCTDNICGASPPNGSAPGQFNQPQGFAIDPNDILYIADRLNNRIQRFTPDGLFAGQAKSDCNGVNCFVVGQFGTAKDVSVNASRFFVLDEDTDILHIFATSPVTMTGPDTAEVTYQSFNNFIGSDSFDFRVSDGLRINGELVRSEPATASISVARNFRPPVATEGIAASGLEDNPLTLTLDGSDPDIGEIYPWEPLDTLSFSLSTPPANGSVQIVGDSATYLPDPDWNGIDSFEFTVSDGVATSAPEQVLVSIDAVNDAPQVAAPSDPQQAGLGFTYELSLEVRDPDSVDEHTVSVDWGDGTVEQEGEILPDGTISGPLIDFNPSGDGLISAQHVYTAPAMRTVQACVVDAANSSGCQSFVVTVLPMTDLNLFESAGSYAVQLGQPVLYSVAISNFAPPAGGGIPATGGLVEIDLDPRLSIVGLAAGTGVNCSGSGNQRSCSLPTLTPIARGNQTDPPPVDRAINITAVLTSPLPPGTPLTGSAVLTANEPNRNPVNQLSLERVVVANADFVVSADIADSHDANPGNGLCADSAGRCSLRAAVEEANALGGARRIALAPRNYRVDEGEITVLGEVELIGTGVGRSEIVSQGPFRIFDVASSATLTLRQLGLAGTNEVSGFGGLIRNAGDLHIEDALLQQGRANGGGAIANLGGASLTLHRCALVGNQSNSQGGGAINNAGLAQLENVLLFDNRANYGGAINSIPIGAGTNLSLSYSTVVGNRSSSVGAALFGNFSDAPMAILSNTILADNAAAQPGGGGTCWSQLLSNDGNIINDDLELCSFAALPGDQLGQSPGLQAYLADGNDMPTLLPTATSIAIGAAIGDCPDSDLRGMPRGDGPCDTGAYRYLGDPVFSDSFE